ncbi:unnamed protein product [Rangifer tarandus platyrhynchus]|uniref:Uncharacterized protein n=2 Tax=Rangifer tarandus platyrhynchus TaxID=3082113 RepID=A0AC59Y990_RANTA|nr:unnamed protein product [Rangifer tarandus platyrhynchus]
MRSIGGTLCLIHPSGLGGTLVPSRLLAHPRCFSSCHLTRGLCPSSLCPPLVRGTPACPLGASQPHPQVGGSPSATCFVPPKPPVLTPGLRPAILCGAPPDPSQAKPELWGQGWAAP